MRQLSDGTDISVFGFGCSSYWAKPSYSKKMAINIVHRAYVKGVNYFDTGASYANGEGERRLGVALKDFNRDSFVVSTKCGTFLDQNGRVIKSFEPLRLRASLNQSLNRLQLDYVDIFYLHGPSLEDMTPEVMQCLCELKKEGLIRQVGINTFDRSVLRGINDLPFDVVMAQYNIIDVDSLDELVLLRQSGKTIISATLGIGSALFSLQNFYPFNKKTLWYLLRTLKNDPTFLIARWNAKDRLSESNQSPLESVFSFAKKNDIVSSFVFNTTEMLHLEQNLQYI